MMNCGVYKITNTVTGDFYIGSSCNIRRRTVNHRNDLAKNAHANRHLQNAWNKYSADNFEFSTILLCAVEKKLYFEQRLLDLFNPAYNIAINAVAPMQGSHMSEEHKRKLIKANTGRRCSEETKRKLSVVNKGKHPSEESRAKMSESAKGNTCALGSKHTEEQIRKLLEANTGSHRTDEVRARMSESQKGRHHLEETREKMSVSQKARWQHRKASEVN